jgi:hypothetical protein
MCAENLASHPPLLFQGDDSRLWLADHLGSHARHPLPRGAGVLETAIAGLRELPLNLVVTSGPGTDPARFGAQPSHTLLLPQCRLVVSHGGAGIMFSALAHGLPQLILPQVQTSSATQPPASPLGPHSR